MIKTLDFHILRKSEGFQLDIYPRDTSELLTTTYLNFPRSLLNGIELKYLDFEATDPAKRIDRLREYGERLYRHIFTPEVASVWLEQKQTNEFLVLCIRTVPTATELEAIAWETLFDGDEFISAGTKTIISRLPLDVRPQVALPAVPLPLQMLILVSSPLDLPDHSRLQIEREQEILLEAIDHPSGQGRIRGDFEDQAQLEVLEGSFETPYHILHFTGHGIAPENGGGLLLEDAQGNSRPTAVSEILQSLQRGESSLRLIVLAGCQTARTLNIGGFQDLARGLLRRGFPAVVAMQFSISDVGGLKFAEALYKSILSGTRLELAVRTARRTLWLSDDDILRADALAPVLLTTNGDCLQTTIAPTTTHAKQPEIDFSFHLSLPQLSHGFYGRRHEYRQVRDAILQRNQRAVIIHGIGGVGKTSLVSHVATRLRDFFQGVYAFDCSGGVLTPEIVIIKLHQYFAAQGVNTLENLLFQSLPPDVLATYLSQVLSQWSLLLIFDNFESQLKRTDADFQIAEEHLQTFIATLVKTTATRSHFLFTSRYLFDLDRKQLGTIHSLPLENLSRPEALSLMQKLQHLAAASYLEKLEVLETFGGHPYALVTVDRYCNHQPLVNALKEAKLLHSELREFLAIEVNYAKLSVNSRELLNRLAAFRQIVPYQAAEWVMGQTIPTPPEVLQYFVDDYPNLDQKKLTPEWKDLSGPSLKEKIQSLLPEKRQGQDVGPSIRELIAWGMITVTYDAEQLTGLTTHELVRAFCRDQQPKETWQRRLRDASGFYRNWARMTPSDEITPEAMPDEIEAFELLIEAEAYDEALTVLCNIHMPLWRWGYSSYLHGQYRFLLGKLQPPESAKLLHHFGVLMQEREEYDTALDMHKSALKIFEGAGNQEGVAKSLHEIGVIHQHRGNFDAALKSYRRSMEISEQLEDIRGKAYSLGQIGVIYSQQGEYDLALRTLHSVLELSRSFHDLGSEAITLHEVAFVYEQQEDLQKALEAHQSSLRISQQLGHLEHMARSSYLIGNILFKQRDYAGAKESYQRALDLNEQIGSSEYIVRLLYLIGMIHRHHDSLHEALQSYQRALAVTELTADREIEAELLLRIAEIHQTTGSYESALEMYGRHLTIAEASNDESGIAESLSSIGRVHSLLGNNHKALELCQRALDIGKRLDDDEVIADSLSSIGWVHQVRGDYEKALECYNRQQALEEKLGRGAGLAVALHRIGMIHETWQEYDTALEYYQRELEIEEGLGQLSGIAGSLHHIGIVYFEKDEHGKALECFQRVLQISEELGALPMTAAAVGEIGMIYQARGDYEKALECYQRELKISEEVGERSSIAVSLSHLGSVHEKRRDYQKALEYFQRGLESNEEVGDRPGIAQSLAQLGIVLTQVERFEEAFKHFMSALDAVSDPELLKRGIALSAFKALRESWGESNFDAAWRSAKAEDLPEWFRDVDEKAPSGL